MLSVTHPLPRSHGDMARIRFTERTLRALKSPASGRSEFFDATTPGFGLRVSASGGRRWFVMFRIDGRLERLTIGPAGDGGLSLADARQRAKDALNAAAKGKNLAAEKRVGRKVETFEELAARYIEEHAKPSKRSWARDKEILDRDVLPAIGRLKANRVTRADVKAILRGIVARGAPVMANRTLEVVRGVFNWAMREEVGAIITNPCAQMAPPGGEESSRERALSDAEVKAFWGRINKAKITRGIGLALRLILVTAQRKGEVASARWEEIDHDAAVWTIPADRSKNGLAHRVPLSTLALELLAEAKALAGHSSFVFPSPHLNRPVTAGALNNAAFRSRATFGIGPFTPHDLRRTAATQMASMGVPRLTVGKVLNHIEAGVTSVYDRYAYDIEKRQALDAWAHRLSEIVGRTEPERNVASLDERRRQMA